MQNQQRGFFGVIIPLNILDSKELTIAEKFVYAYVASYAKCCFDSNERIAERIGVSKETVSRALSKLQKLKYVYVEFVNNNSSARRLYAIFENPKKLEYLSKKGMFQEENHSFPQASQIDARQNVARQNDEEASQNDEPHNGGEASQIVNQRIKNKKKKENTEQKPNLNTAGLAGNEPAGLVRPERKNFANTFEFIQACKTFREGQTCGIENR